MAEADARSRRPVPVDLVAVLVIALVVLVTNRPFIRSALRFDDPSWLFHFGRRVARGDVPYRDFEYRHGPLPLYVDAAFQHVFGAKYFASLYAGLAIKTLRVFVMWKLARRIGGIGVAAPIAMFCCLDPTFSYGHHASLPYAELAIALAGLALISEYRPRLQFGLAGVSVSLAGLAMPSVGVTAAVLLLVATGALCLRDRARWGRLAAAAAGVAVGTLAWIIGVVAIGGFGALAQTAIAPDLLACLLGRAATDASSAWWVRGYVFLGLPVLFVALVLWLAAQRRAVTASAIAVAAVPGLIIGGLLMRYAFFDLILDVPRLLLIVVASLAMGSRRWQERLGIEPVMALALGALPLALPPPAPSLLPAAVLLLLSSARIGVSAKRVVGVGAAAIALVHVVVALRTHVELYAIESGKHVHPAIHVEKSIFSGLRVSPPQARLTNWLAAAVTPGATCFVSGNAPILYDLLSCGNPTRFDVWTATGLPEELAAAAPTYLIVRGDPGLSRYDLVDSADHVMGPDVAKLATQDADALAGYRLYQRRR